MEEIMLAIMIINIVLWVLVAMIFAIILYGLKASYDNDKRVAKYQNDIETLVIKYQLLEETLADYKQAYPIKTKYRNGASVFIVEGKKPHKGVIVEIRQDAERRIFYTVQYKEEGRSGIKSVCRPQHEIYESLAIAIESEQLITL